MIQGLFILLGSWLLFGMSWGNPVAAGVLLVAIALAGFEGVLSWG